MTSNLPSSVDSTVQLIQDAIADGGGCIPFSQFMEISLFGPRGYYSSAQARFGTLGHFQTSPEISPRFGASIGRQLAHTWDTMGRPSRFEIVEMGAGSGSLAAGLLYDAQLFNPDFFSSLDYQIVEYGDLIEGQQARLHEFHDRPSPVVSWIRGSALDIQVGQIKGAFISNELFDAFPVEVATLRDGVTMQMYVASDGQIFRPAWREAGADVRHYIDRFGITLHEGIEEPINLNAIRLQQTLCRSLERGVILTIDYGNPGEVGGEGKSAVRVYGPGVDDLPQATRRKRAFTWPSKLDLTTSVNFAPLLRVAGENGLKVVYSGPQGGFLRGCGILSFCGGDEKGMPARDRHLIADSGSEVFQAQFLAKGIPNLTMRFPTAPSMAAASGQHALS